jgi:hypothetical protein
MRNLGLALFLAALLGIAPAQAQIVTTAPFPQGGQPNNLVASATGTTGSFTATLTGVAGKWTYLCGFVVTSAGTTSATLGNIAITGTLATMNYEYAFVSSGQGILGVAFPGCISSSAVNTSIVVTLPAGGAGTVAAITAWGYTN